MQRFTGACIAAASLSFVVTCWAAWPNDDAPPLPAAAPQQMPTAMTALRTPPTAASSAPLEADARRPLAAAERAFETPLRAALEPAMADPQTQDAANEIVTALEQLEREVSAPQQ